MKKMLYNNKTIIYKLKFIDSYRFMSSPLPGLADSYQKLTKKNANLLWKKKYYIRMGIKDNRLS